MKSKKLKGTEGALDVAWSALVKLRAGMTCEYCGKIKNLQSHHIYTRHNRATRWEPKNGVALCANHHTLSPKFSAHKTPVDFIKWLERTRGTDQMEILGMKAHGISKLHKFEKEMLLDDLRQKIEILTQQRSNRQGIYKAGDFCFKILEK